MKKFSLLFVLFASIIFVYCLYIHIFAAELSKPIKTQDVNIVYKIEKIEFKNGVEVGKQEYDKENYEKILNIISNSKPTRDKSVNDTPTNVKEYFLIKVYSGDEQISYFLYKKKSIFKTKYCIEIPYSGIYKISPDEFDYLNIK